MLVAQDYVMRKKGMGGGVEAAYHQPLGLEGQIGALCEADIKPIYRDIVVGPKYRPFSDISLCICCIHDWTFPENIVVVPYMTECPHNSYSKSRIWAPKLLNINFLVQFLDVDI